MKPCRLEIVVFLSLMAVACAWAASVGFSIEKIAAGGHKGYTQQTTQNLSLPDGGVLFRQRMPEASGRTSLENKAHSSVWPLHPQTASIGQAQGRASLSGPSLENSPLTSHRRRSWDAREHTRTSDGEPGPTSQLSKVESPLASESPREAPARKGENLTAPSRMSLELSFLSSPQGPRKAKLGSSRRQVSPDPLLDASGLKHNMAAHKTGRKMTSMKIKEGGIPSKVDVELKYERNRQRRKRDADASVGAESTYDDDQPPAKSVPDFSLAEREKRQSADKNNDDDDDDIDDDDIEVPDDDNDAGSKAYEDDDLDDLFAVRRKRGDVVDSNSEESDFSVFGDQQTGFVQTRHTLESSRDKRHIRGTSGRRELTTEDPHQDGKVVPEVYTSSPIHDLQTTDQKHHRSHRDKRQADDDASDDDDDDDYELEDESDFALERKKRLLKDKRSIRAKFAPFGRKGGDQEDPVKLYDQRDVRKFQSVPNVKQDTSHGPRKGAADNSVSTSMSDASERRHVVDVTLKQQTGPRAKTRSSLIENTAPLVPGPVEAHTEPKLDLDMSAVSGSVADNRGSLLPMPNSYELRSNLDSGLPSIIAVNDELFLSSYDAESLQIFENLRRIRQESMLDNEVFNSNQPLQQISGASSEDALPSMQQISAGMRSDDMDPSMGQMKEPTMLKAQEEVPSKLHKRHASHQLFGGNLTGETKPPSMVEGHTSKSNDRTEDGNVKTIITVINERKKGGSFAEPHQAVIESMSSGPHNLSNGKAKSIGNIDDSSSGEREAVSAKVNRFEALKVSASDRKAQMLDAGGLEEAVSSNITTQAYNASAHANDTNGKVAKTAMRGQSTTNYQKQPRNALFSLQQRPLMRFNASKVKQTAGKETKQAKDERQNGAKQSEDDMQSQIELGKHDPADNKTKLLHSSVDKSVGVVTSLVVQLQKNILSQRQHPNKLKKAKIDPCSNGAGSVDRKCENKVQEISTDNESNQTNVHFQKTLTGHSITKDKQQPHWQREVEDWQKEEEDMQRELEDAENATRNTSEDVNPNKVTLVKLLTSVAQEIDRHWRSKPAESRDRDDPSSGDSKKSPDRADPGAAAAAALDRSDDGDGRVQKDDSVGQPSQASAEARSYLKPDNDVVGGAWDQDAGKDQERQQQRDQTAGATTLSSSTVGDVSASVQSSRDELGRHEPEASTASPVPRSQRKFKRSWLKEGDGVRDPSHWDGRRRRQSWNIIKDIVDADDDLEEDDDDDDIENDDMPDEEEGVDLNTFL